MRRRGLAATACLVALALTAVAVPALHSEEHAREAEADARAIAPRGAGPIVRVVHHISDEIEGVGHLHADGTWHAPGPHHHHHDGDRNGEHGANAPEHFSFALAASVPPMLPPPHVTQISRAPLAPITVADARAIEAHRNRGPPANA